MWFNSVVRVLIIPVLCVCILFNLVTWFGGLCLVLWYTVVLVISVLVCDYFG